MKMKVFKGKANKPAHRLHRGSIPSVAIKIGVMLYPPSYLSAGLAFEWDESCAAHQNQG